MMLGDVDLSHLSDEERNKILQVLRRDELLQEAEQKRIRSLREEVKNLRLKGIIREGRNSTQTCARCRESFGLFFNKGSVCPKCQHRVCKKCQESVASGKWMCIFCVRQMEFEAKSGNWFYSKFPRKMRDLATNEIISGGKIVENAISNSGKSLKSVSAFQMNSSTSVQHSPKPAAVHAIPSPSAAIPQQPLDPGSISNKHHQNIESGNIPQHPTASSSSSSVQSLPVISVIPELQGTLADDARSLRSNEESDFDIKPRMTSTSPTNLSRLSAMTGSTESVMSYYSCAGEGNFGKIDVTGEVQFGVKYEPKTSSLEIIIRRCKDLAAADQKKNRSDPYVKSYLLPDKSRTGKRKTHCKKNTLNPVFDEVLKYTVKRSEIESRTLCVMVWNYDRFGRNDFLGEVNLPLTLDVLEDTSLKWYRLSNRVANPLSVLAYKGDLDISLKFDNARRVGGKIMSITERGELQVLVKQARNLTALRSSNASDPFCQAYLLPHRSKHDKQKSAVVKHTCSPVWNHTFIFEGLTEEDLRQSSIELTIWDHDRLTSHEFLGGVRLNLGTGKSNTKEVEWMDAKGDEMSLWQAMLDRPNTWIDGTLLLRVHMIPRK